jgi:DNA-3-methyladenine glycosylase
MTTLTRSDLDAHSSDIAPLVLGAVLTSRVDGRRGSVRLTEVEAYGGVGEDPGSHAFRRETPRNATMFGPPGCAYVYFTYGMHWCANIVTGPSGQASAILVRAGEVVEGVEIARSRRPTARAVRDLARGPARLTTALGITGDCDGVDLLARRSVISLEFASALPADRIGISGRTGVGGAGAATPWRFYLLDDPTVSPFRPTAR